jgi:glycosyltransferase involved in cell wall biosynthesis
VFVLNSTKKILICSNYAWTVFTFRLPLVRALKKNGYEVHLLTQEDEYMERISNEFDSVHNLFIDRAGINPIVDFVTSLNIAKVLFSVRPDCFLTFTIKPTIYGGIVARFLRIPTIPNITGLGATFLKNGLLNNLVKFLYHLSLGGAKCVFFQNNDDKKLFIDEGLVSAKKTKRIPGSGIDLKKFVMRDKSMHNPDKCFRFLLVARMLWDKGIGEYVDAANSLAAKYPEVDFCLLGFLGVQNPSAISASQMDAWVAGGVIKYLGVSNDVRDELNDADCVVLPSYREGVPRTLLEAAAMGLPIIASDAVGCRDAVDDGKSGFLCQTKNARDLADKMERVINMPITGRNSMGRIGRRKMESDFDQEIVFSMYLQVIKEMAQ